MFGFSFRIGILGFLTYKRAMSELSFQEVYITDPLHPYIRYIYTLCVYIRSNFLAFLSIFWDFYDFYGFFGFFIGFFSFSFWILFRLSLKKRMGRAVLSFSHRRISFHNKTMYPITFFFTVIKFL